MKIKISLTEDGSKVLHHHGIAPESYMPAYGGESAGLDLYNAGPTITLDGRNKWVAFGEASVLVPTGLRIALPKNTVALVKERGSITSTGLILRAGVIDPGYTDEIFVNLVNVGERDTTIPSGAKLPLQLVVLPCLTDYSVISNLEFLKETKDAKRKSGSLGSSNAPPPAKK
jgi:dUTPase